MRLGVRDSLSFGGETKRVPRRLGKPQPRLGRVHEIDPWRRLEREEFRKGNDMNFSLTASLLKRKFGHLVLGLKLSFLGLNTQETKYDPELTFPPFFSGETFPVHYQ